MRKIFAHPQKAAWRDLHKDECTYLAAVAPRVPTDTARLMARAVIRLRKGELQLHMNGVSSDRFIFIYDYPR